MSTKLTLSNDNWVMVRDPKTVTEAAMEPLEDLQFEVLNLSSIKAGLSKDGTEKTLEKLGGMDDREVLTFFDREAMKIMRTFRRTAIVTFTESWSFDAEVSMEGVLSLPHSVVMELWGQMGEMLNKGVGLNTEPSPEADSPTEHSDA